MERADYLNTYQESYFEDHLEKDSNLNVFGWASTNPIYGGTGSGSSDSSNAVDILTSLKDAGKMSNMTKLFLEIRVNSFCKKEADMLAYVKNRERIELSRLDGFSEEVKTLLMSYTKMPEERADRIAETVEKKIEYLRLFQSGKKIWKREKYW